VEPEEERLAFGARETAAARARGRKQKNDDAPACGSSALL